MQKYVNFDLYINMQINETIFKAKIVQHNIYYYLANSVKLHLFRYSYRIINETSTQNRTKYSC